MKKLYAFIILPVICLLALTGCAGNKKAQPSSQVSSAGSSETQSVSEASSSSSASGGAVSAAPASSAPIQPVSSLPASKNAKGVPVLLYHHLVAPEEMKGVKNGLIASTVDFEAQMKALYDNGYRTVTLDELCEYIKGKTTLPEKSICITFDDGYKTNAYYAAPILRKYGFKAAVLRFVC